MILSDRMKEIRLENHLTQQQVADRIGVHKSAISYYELGYRYPSYDVLVKFACAFNVSTDYLLGINRHRTIDVTGLSEGNICVVVAVVNALKQNSKE